LPSLFPAVLKRLQRSKMALDTTSIEFFLPILSFLIVFIVGYFLIHKSNLIDSKWISALLSFIVSTVFVTVVGARTFVLVIVPFFAVLIVALFLFLALSGFLGKDVGLPGKAIGIVFIVIMAVIFVISAFFVFAPYFSPYLPWNSGAGATNSDALLIARWIGSPQIIGAILLLGISAVVAWILVKAK
jgi:hypothetical protein